MSYRFFLRIQCSMGNEEKEIINYIIFGKREELTQFPVSDRSVTLCGEERIIEIRPVYLFWDKTDEIFLQISEKCSAKMVGSVIARAARKHIQNKYKEVFLNNTETLFLSEKAQREIPVWLHQQRTDVSRSIHLFYAEAKAKTVLAESETEKELFLVLDEDVKYEQLRNWLLETETAAGSRMANLFLFGLQEQKENGELILEEFYEQTGMAGSFYPTEELKRILSETENEVVLLDGRGLSVGMIGRPSFYMDGAGVRTEKEMRRLSGVCKACYGLRNHLDRAFLSAL